ncbi:phage holin [Solibacillus cecembensis]|uniref:phage holin n=1 Tax=Solibacillus cecembensis TaxID=459347 RepID=UPI003CFD95C8
MKINWKVRLKHKPFLVAMFALVLLLVQQVAAIFGLDTTIYNEQVTELFNTVLAILVAIGVVVDPTTDGTNDSIQALRYDKPKGDAK